MTYELYILALMIAAAIATGLALIAWRRRPAPGSTELALLLLAIALWSLATGLEAAADERASKLVFAAISYVGSQSTPVLVFLFAVRYTQRDGWLTPGRTALLFVVPVLSVVMAVTNEWHRLLWREVKLVPINLEVAGIFVHGPWFTLVIVYGYALLAISVIVVSAGILQAPRRYFRQTLVLLAAAVIPWLANLAYTLRPSFLTGIDPTPIAFTISGLLLLWAIARYHFLTVLPIARDRLIEEMDDAVLVLDRDGCVIDLNPTGCQLFGTRGDALIGQTWAAVLAAWGAQPHALQQTRMQDPADHARAAAISAPAPTELVVGQGDDRRTFELRYSAWFIKTVRYLYN
jgi:PAS domain-containing protein